MMIGICIGMVVVGGVVGFLAGWFLKSSDAPAVPDAEETGTPEKVDETADTPNAADEKMQKANEVLEQLHRLTTVMSESVGSHNAKMQEINDELSDPDNQDVDVIISAVSKLVEANVEMQSQLQEADQRLQEQAQEMEAHIAEARTDSLTKIKNRRAFDDELERCVIEYQKTGRTSSVMMIDVDFFKKFNDTHGHQAGDEVLRGVARTLSKSLPEKEAVCRYGGEEFAVIFPGSAADVAKAAAERARAAITKAVFPFEGVDLKVTASAGLAQIMDGETGEQTVKRADDALYGSKEAGRNCGHLHDGSEIHPITDLAARQPVKAETKPEPPTDSGDALPLSTRKAFTDDLQRRLAEWRRGGSELSVMMLRVDEYDDALTTLGSDYVKLLDSAAARCLQTCMRDMDHAARLDDSTYLLLLPSARLKDAITVSNRMFGIVKDCAINFAGKKQRFTFSMGSAAAVTGESADQMVDRAEASMSVAEQRGGDCAFVHDGRHVRPIEAVDEVAI